MDPQSLSFTPQSDIWRLSNTMRNFQDVQQEHADRLMRLERRHDEDSRLKAVWGSASPFPGILSGTPATPQHGPVSTPSGVDFSNFDDDQSNSMVRSLHLDADDEHEPRRYGVGSRANSVRFDESAKPGQWAHASRSSVDLLPRSASGFGGFGGHLLFERTTSHKSDGRQSSASQSAVSGRANSLMMDSANALASSSDSPGFAPGLFILGTVPSIIRCWLSTNFKHESLLYAAVCTGSYKSFLDKRVVESLGLSSEIRLDLGGDRKVRVPVYLPEAIQQSTSSRSSSPSPQLPSLMIDFTVIDRGEEHATSKAIQIMIGSDTLRAHNADILLSSNTMTLFVADRCKLSIPFVRPENDEVFKGLATGFAPPAQRYHPSTFSNIQADLAVLQNGTEIKDHQEQHGDFLEPSAEYPTNDQRAASPITNDSSRIQGTAPADTVVEPNFNQAYERKPSSTPPSLPKRETKDVPGESPAIAASSKTPAPPAIWGNWRRDGTTSTASDWANATRNSSTSYQRTSRDQGMKVLKPIRQVPRATSTTALSASPSLTGQSRFFDDGKRRNGPPSATDGIDSQQTSKRSMSGERAKLVAKESTIAPTAPPGINPRSVNPIGGASAFGWLHSGGPQK